MLRPLFIEDDLTSGEVRAVARNLLHEINHEQNILLHTSGPVKAIQEDRIEALKAMMGKAQMFARHLRQEEERQMGYST